MYIEATLSNDMVRILDCMKLETPNFYKNVEKCTFWSNMSRIVILGIVGWFLKKAHQPLVTSPIIYTPLFLLSTYFTWLNDYI